MLRPPEYVSVYGISMTCVSTLSFLKDMWTAAVMARSMRYHVSQNNSKWNSLAVERGEAAWKSMQYIQINISLL
jgi:hypothetical protein